VEAHLIIEQCQGLPEEEAFRKRFAAALKLFANC
jgi:hypothetical protein